MISQLSKGGISGILDKISQAAREESQGVSWIRWYEAQFIQLAVGSKSVSGGLKKIMKELQAWLNVELREVRKDKKGQVDAEDEQACSSIKRCRHKVKVMDLD
ncbi:hypothetical protein Bca52824_056987 [Brassica carinata]|uniref:Uncharacterized protein n=1 Tax=Brassica carinata TaxID=52824 RepID=A0A8X7QQD5_BRACI|nr:hypothetical protein Bca52824_056987 [Brassica carinata]